VAALLSKSKSHTSINPLVAQDEQEQNPDLRVHQRFFDLRYLDLLVVHASTVGLAARDEQGLLLVREELCRHDVVWEEKQQNNAPNDRQPSAKQIDDSYDPSAIAHTSKQSNNSLHTGNPFA
jgi:hypothetical protein